jgi:serine/threonine-protein kinase
MQPPIPLGTVLQNRYRLIKILGQGGFGRTYLAEDLGRFKELCALKELIPSETGTYALEKSKELFQREAAILYQIQHPQVPQFRATFEQDQRLFLVQDYVEGKTYRALLDERKAASQTFSEAEVLQLLRQLLPVLAHLHIRGIIHRDISPENIILRESDAKPVLIDFGVVKELATRFQSPNITPQPTTVGKLGYAPSEQLQTGRAYPSSDLYALAVTCVVLLTGREPQELFDDTQLSWNWRRWATVSSGLTQMLNRMLSYKPSDRYQSVADVAKALQALNNQFNNQNNPQLPTLNRQLAAPELSQLQTIAVGRRPDLIESSTSKQNQPAPVIPAPKTREIWDNPWAIAIIGIFVALLAGIGSWALVSYMLANQRPVPQTFPSPIISESPTPPPTPSETPTPTPSPINYSQRLNLATGETTSVEGSLKANATIDYTFRGEQEQQLSAALEEEGVLLTVLGPNQEPINDLAERVTRYQGTLPFTGDYTVQLSPVVGVEQSRYKLNLRLENPVEPTPSPTPIPTPTVTPSFEVESINFNTGETTTQVSGQTRPQQIKRYLVNAQEGQIVSVAVQQGAVTLDIRNSDGELVEAASKVLSWEAQVLGGGEYQIDVIANLDQDTEFTLNVSVRNLE